MENIQMLQEKKALLLKELELVSQKISFLEKFDSQEQKVISEPCSEKSQQSETTPEQTAPGKELSNPLMAMILPKDQNEIQISSTLVKPSDLNLRPNGNGIQNHLKTECHNSVLKQLSEGIQIPGQKEKPYYVVFNGFNAGIYDSWKIAELATKGVSGVKHKKYSSFLKAKVAADQYCRDTLQKPLELICSSEGLKPSTFKDALQMSRRSKVTLGKIPSFKEKTMIEEEITYDGFSYLINLARKVGNAEAVENNYFTTDGKNISYFNFLKNADPEFVFEAFSYGLIKLIYPSQNLLELRDFPKELKQGIKQFRKNCVKGDKDICLKITSSLPQWNDTGMVYQPHHIIQISICKKEDFPEGEVMENKICFSDHVELSKRRFEVFCNKLYGFNDESKVMINYCDNYHLVYSSSGKPITEQGIKQILSFMIRFEAGLFTKDHLRDFCKIVGKKAKSYGRQLTCKQCHKDEIIQQQLDYNMADPIQLEESMIKVEDASTSTSSRG